MTVRVFRSTDTAAPALTSGAGSLVNVLTACLVNGYGSVTIATLTQISNIATATVSASHNYTTGNYITISGVTPSNYNGSFIITVTSPTTFTYIITGAPSSGTGTMIAVRASAGWTLPFTPGPYQAVYKQGVGSNGRYLQIIDMPISGTGAQTCSWTGFISMTSLVSGLYPFPNIYQLQTTYNIPGVFIHTGDGSGTVKPWMIVATEKAMHLWINTDANSTGNSPNGGAYFFGDIVSNLPGDTCNTLIIGSNSYTYTFNSSLSVNTTSISTWAGNYISGNLAQDFNSISAAKFIDKLTSTMGFPHIVDGSALIVPIGIFDGNVRGTLPGMWWPMHAMGTTGIGNFTDGTQISFTTGDLAGKTFEYRSGINGVIIMYEISNTW